VCFSIPRKASRRICAVEFDKDFYKKINPVVTKNKNILLILHEPKYDVVEFPSHKKGFEGLDFKDYVQEIENHGDLDLIIIDGRARESCLEYAVKHLKKDGMILFDNTLRKRYLKKIAQFDEFEVEHIKGLTPSLPYPDKSTIMRFKS
jgi:tRNA A58 N-methylase Trm61